MNMFCGSCGAENDNSTKFCGVCGAVKEPPVTPAMPESSADEKLVAGFSIGSFAHFSAPAGGQARLEIGGQKFQADLVFKCLAVALVAVLVFLPFLVHGFSIGGYSNQVSRNFFRHIFGSVGTIFSFFVLITPVALFCLFQFQDKIKIDSNLRYIAIMALSVFGFITPFIVRARIFSPLRAVQASPFVNVIYWIRPSVGFILTLLLYLVVAAIAFGFLQAGKGRPKESGV